MIHEWGVGIHEWGVVIHESGVGIHECGVVIHECGVRRQPTCLQGSGLTAFPCITHGGSGAGGWFHSGDLAVVHGDGYVEVKDRAKDIIISGGENISTVEVEGALFRHPDVLEAAVVARPDPKWGETPMAFVVLKEGRAWTPCTEQSIIDFCRGEGA